MSLQESSVQGQDNSSKPRRSPRGFAAMDPQRQREIASLGGRAAHQSGHAHEFTSEEARVAGRKRHARNDSTLRALDLLRESFDKVEAMHREGLIPEEVTVLRELVDTQLRLLVQLERAKRGSTAEAS